MSPARSSNPLEELYVGEPLTPRDFVKVFSPVLVEHALPLFQGGNVVLKGVQGSGKTMLLKLLHPNVRLAYASARQDFPMPEEFRRFIGAGVNFRRHGFGEFGQRRFDPDPDEHATQFPLYFGDFLNYRVVENILRSLETLRNGADGIVARELGLTTDTAAQDSFAKALAKESCWFGYLDDCDTYSSLRKRIEERIGVYLSFVQHNRPSMPRDVRSSKTRVGQPVSALVRQLRLCGVVPEDVQFFVSIDQYEELRRIAPPEKDGENGFQRVVNKALGSRDQFVSYRIGVRSDAWRSDIRMHGTAAVLEGEREYQELSLDDLLTRREDRKSWIFPAFAEDVLRRRLEYHGYDLSRIPSRTVAHLLGKSVAPDQKAAMYVGSPGAPGATGFLEIESDWSAEWLDLIRSTAKQAPLEAKLIEAWLRQRGGQNASSIPPKKRPYPWERTYWRKERIQQALLRLASASQQRLIFAGEDDVLNLSGGNILVFVSVMRSIWATWLRSTNSASTSNRLELPRISPTVQSSGIHVASERWFEKIIERPDGDKRRRFVVALGTRFQRALSEDKSMSYPGHNGISLALDDLQNNPTVLRFLQDAVDYGDLVSRTHTTKEKNRRARRKWYLMPVLSPYFKIPATHVKEPMYVTAAVVGDWMKQADVEVTPNDPNDRAAAGQQ